MARIKVFNRKHAIWREVVADYNKSFVKTKEYEEGG